MQKRTNLLKTKSDSKKTPCSLFNGMINSFAGYAMRGVIWYQGEANRFNTKLYPALFAAMRNDWQQRWDIGDFPIYICQVAPYDYDNGKSLSEQRNSAFLRETMFKIAVEQPNVEMAVLMDLGEKDCIHASRKRQVGERLSYIALARDYGYDGLEYKAPTYQSATFEDGNATIAFDNISAGFYKNRIITSQFEVAGADHKFHPATEYEIKGNKIVIKSSDVAEPIAVRYAFKDFIDGSLFGANGLPVSSFRSDNWDDVQ